MNAEVLATFMFVDIRGFTKMTQSIGHKKSFGQVDRFHRLVDAAVIKHQGIIDNLIGDAVMVHYGATNSPEKQVDRAIASAIEIQAAIQALSPFYEEAGFTPLKVGIGIATGYVTVGIAVNSQWNRTLCIGEPVNLAARLTAEAGPGQILINRDAVEHASRRQSLTALKPLSIRGVKGKVMVFEASLKLESAA